MLQESIVQGQRNTVGLRGARRGPQARAATLRAEAKQALERLAGVAEGASRQSDVDAASIANALDLVARRLNEYCQYLARQLEPALLARGAFGSVLASYLKHFEQRQRDEIAQLVEHLALAPRSVGVAHAAFVTAIMLIAELDVHGRDVASVMKSAAISG